MYDSSRCVLFQLLKDCLFVIMYQKRMKFASALEQLATINDAMILYIIVQSAFNSSTPEQFGNDYTGVVVQ